MKKIICGLIFGVAMIPFCYANSEYDQADQHLNAVYKKLIKMLSGDNKKSLQNSQRFWIKYTDENCKLRAENYIDSFKAYAIRERLKRTEALVQLSESSENYLGECAKEQKIGNRTAVPCFIESTKHLEIEITNLLIVKINRVVYSIWRKYCNE